MIKYEDILSAYRAENVSRENNRLEKIQRSFYSDAKELFAAVENKYREDISKDLERIYDIREKKIALSALRSRRGGKHPENLLPEEEGLYREMCEVLKKHREDILDLDRIKTSAGEEHKEEGVEVRFMIPIPAFVGADLKRYGPFKEGDKAVIPKESARILIEKEAAELF